MNSALPIRRSSGWQLLFLIALLIDLVFVYLDKSDFRYVSKSLLMPLLAIFYLSASRSYYDGKILSALIFSWLGDLLLMFEDRDPLFFQLGLASFLVAHIFYIVYFFGLKKSRVGSFHWWVIIPVISYYIALIFLLNPQLGDLRIPVFVYGFVICLMLFVALQSAFWMRRSISNYFVIGAILFVASDSLLAINKFLMPFSYAGILVMLTYGVAQLLIVRGAIEQSLNQS